MIPKGPHMESKNWQKSIKSVFRRGLEKVPQKGTLSRTSKSEKRIKKLATTWAMLRNTAIYYVLQPF